MKENIKIEEGVVETQPESNLNYSPVKEKTLVSSPVKEKTIVSESGINLENWTTTYLLNKGQSPDNKEKAFSEKNQNDDELIQKILKSQNHAVSQNQGIKILIIIMNFI